MLTLILSILSFLPGSDVQGSTHLATDPDTVIFIKNDSLSAKRTVMINRILIIGNKITRDRIITRELTFTVGDTVQFNKLDSILTTDQKKIYNLRLFNTVTIRVLTLNAIQVDLLIEVTERWYTFPAPIFELSDRNFNEWWQNYNHDFRRVNYGLRLYQYNFRGRNETLRLTGQLGYTRRLELSYRIPYIDRKQKQGLIFDFNYAEPKNTAYFTDDHKLVFLEDDKTVRTAKTAQVTYTYRRSFYETHSLSAGYSDTIIADTVNFLNPNYFNDNRTRLRFGSISYSFVSEHRDVIQYPLKGYQITGFIQKLGLGVGDNVNQWEMNLTYARHVDLGKNYYFSNFSSAYLSTPQTQPYALLGALGYRRQFVRGYEIYLIEGPNFFLNKTTLKKKIFSRNWNFEEIPIEQFRHFPVALYLKTYVDLGYVENYPYYDELNINTRLSDRLLGSIGAGLDLVLLYDTVLRFEYTLNREQVRGFFFNVRKEF